MRHSLVGPYWQKTAQRLRLTANFVREHLPPPRLKFFKWLAAPQCRH